jgi:hypothetical protein
LEDRFALYGGQGEEPLTFEEARRLSTAAASSLPEEAVSGRQLVPEAAEKPVEPEVAEEKPEVAPEGPSVVAGDADAVVEEEGSRAS